MSRQYFDAAAGLIEPLWVSNQFSDLYMYTAEDRPKVSDELLFLREEVLLAAESSSVLTEKLFRTMNLVDPPPDYSPLLA